MASDRALDLVVHGATGFTGRLVAEYLAGGAAPPGLRVGLSGRDPARLAAVRDGLGEPAAGWELRTVDAADRVALAALAASTRLVLSTVGPYLRHGLPLVEACAAAGTHYVDLTGEVPFIRDSIDHADGPARDAGARIVHSCGFDSIPSDLGMLALHLAALERTGTGAFTRADYLLRGMSGGVSGGTIASMAELTALARSDPERARLLADPYALSPDRSAEPELGNERDLVAPVREDGRWLGPFVMASINTRVVRRSNALLDYAYGRRLRYREVTDLGTGVTAPVKAAALAGGMAAATAAMAVPGVTDLARKALPKPGDGPDEEARRTGFFAVDLRGTTEAGAVVEVAVRGTGDPGYGATSRMVTEAALAILDGRELPDVAGVLTPATGIGRVLLERLAAADVRFDVREPAA